MNDQNVGGFELPEWARQLNASAERLVEAGRLMQEAARLMRQAWDSDVVVSATE